MQPRRYMWGNELPAELQREALRLDTMRYTGEHRPAWLDGPYVDSDRRNGPPDFEDDAAWLANTEFPIAGHGRHLRLSRNPRRPRTHYLRAALQGPPDGFTAEQAMRLALALAKGAGSPVWVQVEGRRIGDMTFRRPDRGIPSMWRVATPSGDLY